MGKRLAKIQLYNKNKSKEQIVGRHGDCILDDICVSCTVEEDFLTTEHFLDAEFLVDKEGLFKHIEEDAVLKVQMDYGEDIFSIVDVKKTTTRVIVFARQITITESICSWMVDVRPEEKNGQDALNHMGEGATGFHNLEFESDISKKNTAYYQNKSLYDALHTVSNCFMTRWGGEMRRRGYKIIVNEKIGKETGVQIRSGKNLTGFEASTNIDNIVTRIRPIGFNGITTEDYIDSPLINNYKYIRTQEVKYEHVKLKSDLETETGEDGEVQTQEPGEGELVFDTLEEAQAKLTELALLEYLDNLFDVLQADYTVNFVDLAKTEEYKNYAAIETIQLGDEISVYEENHDINIKVRAVKRKFNVLSQKIEEIGLSNKINLEHGPDEIQQLQSRLDIVVEQVGYMNVAYARIEDLEATNLQVDNLMATKADVFELEAAEADIEELDAQVATIHTLVNGNLTSDNIHSLVLTSRKVTVDNGFIKNAMIDTLNASKIRGGSIDTNYVNIMSDNGSLQIIGDLMQFKDDNDNVRIQMGRDTSGDFTFVLYDETGQGQLLNKDGITASAIGDGLIVNDMVAGNANISGRKLDIDSVIKTINNNGSETIKSNRIYLDEEGQSLEVAFNNLTTKVDTLESLDGDVGNLVETVNTHTTSLNVMQGKINTLISDTTITNANGQIVSLKNDYSAFKQDVNKIETTVGILEEANETVTSQISQITQEVDGIETRVSASETTVDGINSTISTLSQKTNSIEAEVNKNGEEIATLKLESDNFEVAIAKKVDSTSIISTINASAEGIKISGDKVNITGFVTFTDLSTGGKSTINGSNITTGTIDASKANITNINASNITSGYISANRISGGTIDASEISVTNLSASNITYGTFSGDRISGGEIVGATLRTKTLGTSTGVGIYQDAIKIGATALFFDESKFKVQCTSTCAISSMADIYLMPGLDASGQASGDGAVVVPGATLRTQKLRVINETAMESTCSISGALSCNSISAVGHISCPGLSSTGGISASGSISCSTIYPSSVSCSGGISASGNISSSGTITAGSTTAIGYYSSLYLGTRNESVSCAAIKMGTGGYMAAYSGFHFVTSGGSAHSLRAGTIYSNGSVVTSDERKKMDIKYVNQDSQTVGESGLMSPNVNITTKDMYDFIDTLPLASFRYTEEVEDGRDFTHYGFLTQDILYSKVGSELVSMLDENKAVGDEDDYMGYCQEKLIMFLCGALQEEMKHRKALEAKVDNLLSQSND